MLLGLINYVRGWVRVEIRGAAIERFLNLCAQNDIAFWDVRRLAPDVVQATVHIQGFRQLRHFTRRMMCSVHIVKKRGVPFHTHRLLPRVALWGGALVCAGALLAATRFLWVVDVTGCDHTLQAEALRLAEEAGLRPGVGKNKVDSEEVRSYIMTNSDNFSFVAVNINGSQAQILAYGRKETPEMVPVDEPCDVVANKDGIIESIQIKAGLGMKQAGDTVVQGDILVTGTMVSALEEVRQVHAMADVTLRTWHTLEQVMPTKVQTKVPTGREKVRRFLVIGSRRIQLSFVEKEPFPCYDIIMEEKQLKLTENTPLPVKLVTERYVEYTPKDYVVTQETAEKVMEQRLEELLELTLPEAQVESRQFQCQYEVPFARSSLQVECREQAGVLQEVSGISRKTTEEGND